MNGHRNETRPARRWRDTALTVGAVVGSLCILATVVSILFGVTPLVFRSGSMAPAIPSGALAIARDVPAAELRAGDVVSVINDQGSRVTHRIVEVQSIAGNTALLRLQGDANPEPDARSYGVSSAERVLFHVDGLGYLVAWLRTVPGLLVLAILSAVLVRIAMRPNGPVRTNTSVPATPLAVLVIVSAVGIAHTPGTGATFTDSATARSGAFTSKAEYVPRISGTVGCTSKSVADLPDPVTLRWTHLGAPYQYRIILRDLDGRVWRTADVTNITVAAGSTITYDLYGTGLPRRSVIWQYNAEVHTMLPGGAVSAAWRGRLVSQPLSAGNHNQDLNCSPSGERDGTPTYVAPPASVTCSTTGTGSGTTAVLTWPHVGTGVTYHITARNPSNGNIAYATTVTATPTTAGQPVTGRISRTNLDTALITADTVVAEVRSVQGGSYSTGFVAYRVSTTSTTGVTCSAPAAGARSLPQVPAAPTTSVPPESAAASSVPGAVTTESSPAPPGSPSAPEETALTAAVRSPSGLYSARLVGSENGIHAVITSVSGDEEYRTDASVNDALRWATETDRLHITGSSGSWVITEVGGSWVKTAVVEPAPAPPPAPAPLPDPVPSPVDEPAPVPVPEEAPAPSPPTSPSDDLPEPAVEPPPDDGSEG